MGSKEKFYVYVTALHPEVTGSCLLVVVHFPNGRKIKFLVDCGLFQEQKYNDLNKVDFPFSSEDIEFVLITHNHADHVGKLPLLCKYGFHGKIFATKSTSKLLGISLSNSYQIMKDDAQWMKTKPLYSEEDVEKVFEYLVPCNIGEEIQINSSIKITYFDNGHIIGAGMILVQICYPGEQDINLFFTGDYKSYNIFKKVRPMPNWVYDLPMNVVIESTYGDTETDDIQYNFEEDVETILKQGKNLFIPVLAQGRAQEILFILKNMQEEGKINKDIPIYLDGNLSHQYTHKYRSGELEIEDDKLEFLPENFHWVDKDTRQFVITSKKQRINLTTSGMLDHGPARLYLPSVISDDKWAIFLTSYCSEGTLGRKLIDNEFEDKRVQIMGMEICIRAQVYSTSQFSSHAKANELLEFLSKFKNLKLVMVNHGETETQKKFAIRVENAKLSKRVEVLGGYTIKLAHYGFIKSMGAKLYTIVKNKQEPSKKEKSKKKKKQKIVCRRKKSSYRLKGGHL